jgi:hypothetical protein
MSTGPIQKTVSPLTESIPNVAVVSTDSLPAKAADAVKKVKTPDVEVSSVVKKMETLNLRDSTTVGCNSCEELPKDRFTKVKDSGCPQYSATLIQQILQNPEKNIYNGCSYNLKIVKII